MNYAEELAYWYFRLNGFFPITNFVLHRGAGMPHPADVDLLAVRFPYISEDIGGNTHDWDKRFQQWGADLNADTIGIIAEVKSGSYNRKDIDRILDAERTRRALLRLGIFKPAEPAVSQNIAAAKIRHSDKMVLRLLIAPYNYYGTDAFLFLSLAEIDEFLQSRLGRYADVKNADRLFFQSSLLQYLAARPSLPSDAPRPSHHFLQQGGDPE
jgi:hypothetical protein